MEYTKIAWYELTSRIQGIGDTAHAAPPAFTRLIILTSEPLLHGIVVKVTLHFSTFFDNWNSGIVGHFSDSDPYAPHLNVYFRLNEYAYYYDILRQEKPVYYGYTPEAPTPPAGFWIREFEIITYRERLGEGNTDRPYLVPVLRLNRTAGSLAEVQELIANQSVNRGL